MHTNAQAQPFVALVTGANRGIGREVARQLAQQGMIVFLTARNPAQASSTTAQLNEADLDIRPYPLDITDDAQMLQLASLIDQQFGRLDVLINNAAAIVDWSETVLSADLDATRQLFETNLFGTWRMCQVFVPLLRRSAHGRIVLVSSGAGSHGDQQFGLTTQRGSGASYGVSKAAVNALTAKLAAELEGSGVRVNAVCPGLTATAPGMEAFGARPISEGAASVVWAATISDTGPNGGFFRDGKQLAW